MTYDANMQGHVIAQDAADKAKAFLQFAEEQGFDLVSTLHGLKTAAASIESMVEIGLKGLK